jgi:IS5 family transposase
MTEHKNNAPRQEPKLREILDPQHALYQLGDRLNWELLENQLGIVFADEGRPPLSSRLIAGLHYLKYLYNESDESVVRKFVENPYWQFFCGFETFQHELPCHPTSLVRWRKKIGLKGVEKLLEETLTTAKRMGLLNEKEIARVNIDTTVQDKAIAFPTDARLYHKARRRLVLEAKRRNIELRQSYARVGQVAFRKQAQYAHAKQGKRARRETRRLKGFLGRVIRDIERKLVTIDGKMAHFLDIAKKIFSQKREDKNKVYAFHAPEVECISKGKVHKKYEFGCKVAIATTSKNSWVVAIEAHHGNPYDGSTLKSTINKIEELTGIRPEQSFVDKGYRGSDHHPKDVEIYLSGRKLKGALKKLLKRRSAIEPIIGHLKDDHGLRRNHLLGLLGDKIHAALCGAAFNLMKILRFLQTETVSLTPA